MTRQRNDRKNETLKRQYIYLNQNDKYNITQLAKSKGMSVSLTIVNLIKEELSKTPSLDLNIEVKK